jgi:hypothetical protein
VSRLRGRVARLEARIQAAHGGLTEDDRALIAAWDAHTRHKYRGGEAPTQAQLELLAVPGFWGRLQAAWGRPAWARQCLQAIEHARRAA